MTGSGAKYSDSSQPAGSAVLKALINNTCYTVKRSGNIKVVYGTLNLSPMQGSIFEGLTPSRQLKLVYFAAVHNQGFLLNWLEEHDDVLQFIAGKAWFKREFDTSDFNGRYANDLTWGGYFLLEGLFKGNIRHAGIRRSFEALHYQAKILKWVLESLRECELVVDKDRALAAFSALLGMYTFTLDHYIKYQERFYANGAYQILVASFAGSDKIGPHLPPVIVKRFLGSKIKLAFLVQQWEQYAIAEGIDAAFQDYTVHLAEMTASQG